jgi:hypothetical protein
MSYPTGNWPYDRFLVLAMLFAAWHQIGLRWIGLPVPA